MVHECTWFALVHPCGGINNNRISMTDSLVYAHLQRYTLALPRVPVRKSMCHGNIGCASNNNKASWWRNTREFGYLYDRNSFAQAASKLNVSWIEELPSCIARHDTFRDQVNAFSIQWKHAPFPKGSGAKLSSVQILADKTWSVTRRCANGEHPTHLPGYINECAAGFVDLECSLYSFGPNSKTDRSLWKSAFNAFQFNSGVKSFARRITHKLTDEYDTFHFRVEDDAHPVHFTGYASRIEAADGWANIVSKYSNRSRTIVVISGLDTNSYLLHNFKTNPSLKGFQIRSVNEIFDDYPKDTEMEYRAAVQYLVCLRAVIHFGTDSSTFDAMLRRERNGVTINMHRNGRVDPEITSVLGPRKD